MIQADGLVPLWPDKVGMPGMEWMSEHPVLITIESVGAVVRGQLLSMNTTRAVLVPDEPLFLCNKTRTVVRFRYSNTVYTLGGMAISSDEDASFLFAFDEVTRRQIALFKALGIDTSQVKLPDGTLAAVKQYVRPKRSPEQQREIMHMAPPGGVERRSSPRHPLEASARMLVISREMMLRCTILEISLSGCRLYSESPFRLDEGDIVEVEFVGKGYPFRLAAEVRLKEEEHLAGLLFTSMSCRCQQRLEELISELASR